MAVFNTTLSKRKLERRIVAAVSCVMFVAALLAIPLEAASGGKTFGATITKISGSVLIKSAGDAIWRKAVEGEALKPGDSLKTMMKSSALIEFPDGGTAKALPLSEIAIELEKRNDVEHVVLGVQTGRTLIETNKKFADSSVVVVAGKTALGGKNLSAFVETSTGGTCFDIIRGSAKMAIDGDSESRNIEEGFRVSYFNVDNMVETTAVKDAPTAYSQESFTCMTVRSGQEEGRPRSPSDAAAPTKTDPAKPEPTKVEIKETPDGQEIALTTAAVVVFGAAAGGAGEAAAKDDSQPEIMLPTTTSEQPAAAETPQPETAQQAPQQPKTSADIEKTDEYEVVVITSTVSATFEAAETKTAQPAETAAPAEPAPAATPEEKPVAETEAPTTEPAECKTPPKVLKILANEINIMPGAKMSVEFVECGEMIVMLSGAADDGCGPVESVMIKIDDNNDEIYKAEGTKKWSYIATFKDVGIHSFDVWAIDAAGAVSNNYEFKLELEKMINPPSATLDTIASRQAPAFGGRMKLNKSRLTNGKMALYGTAASDRCDIERAEVSLNDGAAWLRADGRESWSYSFTPKEGTYEFVARAKDADKNDSPTTQTVEVIYIDKTDEELLKIDFETLMRAYRDKDSGTFVDGVSSTYSSSASTVEDRSRLDQSLGAKFTEQATVYLRYQISSIMVSGNTGRVLFNWDADKTTTGYSHTGTFIFDLDDEEGWRLLTVDDRDTFLRHTSDVAYLSIEASDQLLTANRTDTSIISVVARDSAHNPVKDGTEILLSADRGSIQLYAATQDGVADAVYTAGAFPGTAIVKASRNGEEESVSITLVEEPIPGTPPEPVR